MIYKCYEKLKENKNNKKKYIYNVLLKIKNERK